MSATGVILIVLVLVTLVCDVASEAWLRRSPKQQVRRPTMAEKGVSGGPMPRRKSLPARPAKRPVLPDLESASVSPVVVGEQTEEIVA